ncbi:ABC transporter permease [Brevundimonas sp. VNH65]|uniref:ABC transporter permease n=1 Tax=Brevundimonas sp. VNH65 TaxID=3400917 RepID=UPI003C0D2710
MPRRIDRAVRETRLLGWLLVLAAFLLWEVASQLGWIRSSIVPAVSDILEGWSDELLNGALGVSLLVTLKHMAGGYVIGATLGVIVGVAMGRSRLLWRLLEPLIEMARPVPTSALVPLMILFLGIDDPLKITVVALGAFFPVFINTFAGVTSVSRTLRDTGRTFGVGEAEATLRIILPAAAPIIFVGLRYALSVSLVIALVAEMIAGSDGMGYFVIRAQQNLSVVQLFIGVFTLALLGYALNFLFLWVERLVLPWRAGGERRQAG